MPESWLPSAFRPHTPPSFHRPGPDRGHVALRSRPATDVSGRGQLFCRWDDSAQDGFGKSTRARPIRFPLKDEMIMWCGKPGQLGTIGSARSAGDRGRFSVSQQYRSDGNRDALIPFSPGIWCSGLVPVAGRFRLRWSASGSGIGDFGSRRSPKPQARRDVVETVPPAAPVKSLGPPIGFSGGRDVFHRPLLRLGSTAGGIDGTWLFRR